MVTATWSSRGNRARIDEAAAGPDVRLEPAFVEGHALAHADEPMAGGIGLSRADAGVRDLERQLVLVIAHAHAGRRRTGMGEGVRERFLHDPVRREVDARRQLDRGPLDGQLDGQPGSANAFHQRVEVPQARRRDRSMPSSACRSTPTRRRISASAWVPVASMASRASRAAAGSTCIVLRAAARLENDDADRVRDRVVQLAGDPAPAHRPPRRRPPRPARLPERLRARAAI